LHMTRSDFCELARVLRLVATYPPCGHWIGGHPCAARYNSPESITLQLFGITLCLSTADLFDLQRMVQAALVQLAGHNAAPFWRYIDAEIPEQPEIVIPLN
jgi:hypothetical protein